MASTVVRPFALRFSTAAKAGPREENSATDQASSTSRATRQPSGPCSTSSAYLPAAVPRVTDPAGEPIFPNADGIRKAKELLRAGKTIS